MNRADAMRALTNDPEHLIRMLAKAKRIRCSIVPNAAVQEPRPILMLLRTWDLETGHTMPIWVRDSILPSLTKMCADAGVVPIQKGSLEWARFSVEPHVSSALSFGPIQAAVGALLAAGWSVMASPRYGRVCRLAGFEPPKIGTP